MNLVFASPQSATRRSPAVTVSADQVMDKIKTKVSEVA